MSKGAHYTMASKGGAKQAPHKESAALKAAKEAAEAAEKAALILRAQANPNEFFSFTECGLILGFGEQAMSRLNAAGAPVAFRKMNPALVCQWIASHPQIFANSNEAAKEDKHE